MKWRASHGAEVHTGASLQDLDGEGAIRPPFQHKVNLRREPKIQARAAPFRLAHHCAADRARRKGAKLSAGEGASRLSIRSALAPVPLAAQAEPIDEIVVAFNIRAPEIFQQTATLRDHFEQAAPRMVILLVSFEMFRQVVDALCQQRDLYLWRTGVLFVRAKLLDDLLFHFLRQRHCSKWPSQSAVVLTRLPGNRKVLLTKQLQFSTRFAALSSKLRDST